MAASEGRDPITLLPGQGNEYWLPMGDAKHPMGGIGNEGRDRSSLVSKV